MTNFFQYRTCLGSVIGATGLLVLLGPASAQVRYAEPSPFDTFLSSPNETAGTSPAFEIYPRQDGEPAVRVVARCQYPDGWNVTDFSRDVNGTPAGLDHACPVGGRVRARY